MTYKKFGTGDVFTAVDADLLMRQSVISVADRTEANTIQGLTDGITVWRRDKRWIERYEGGAWKVRGGRPILCRLTTAVVQSWTTAATKLQWGPSGATQPVVPIVDTDGMFNPAQNTRITVPVDGLYRVTFNLLSSGVISAACTLLVNNTLQLQGAGSDFGQAGAGTNPKGEAVLPLVAGDYLELQQQSPATGAGAWTLGSMSFAAEFMGQI